MSVISATAVKDLREKTGAGMMECKKALTESGGDFEKAVDLLRQKGLASAAKKATRSASQGLIAVATSPESGVIAEVNCETDFVARTDDFRALVAAIGSLLLAEGETDRSRAKIDEMIKEKIAKLGENIVFRRTTKFDLAGKPGAYGTYIHMDKIGILVEAACDAAVKVDDEAFKTLMKDISMHVAAASPAYVSREEIPADVIEREKEIYRGQVTGKPANVVEKIIEGKLEKFFSDTCLVNQIFVKDPDGKKKISDLVAEHEKQLAGKISVTRFRRYQIGETSPSEPASC